MGVLENIIQMRSQGYSDEDVVKTLQEQGVSPKAINDALNQAQIKNAVGNFSGGYNEALPQTQNSDYGQGYAQGAPAQNVEAVANYAPQEGYQEYYPQQGYESEYPQQGYGGGASTGTIIEVSEQVFTEKSQKMQKQIKELTEFKTVTESKVESINEKVKRIEGMLDKMQIAILDKIGSYGKNLENMKKEIDMVQDSFGKMVPSIADRVINKSQHHSQQQGKNIASKNPKKR